ncbi:hypothetical protein ACI8AF_11660 [Blastococcus sp. SYSU D00669]
MTFSPPPHGPAHRAVTTPVPIPEPRSPEITWTVPSRRRSAWPWSLAIAALVAAAVLAVVLLPLRVGDAPADSDPAERSATSESTGKVDGAVDSGWHDIALLEGWVATGDGARFRVVDGICYLQLHVALPGGVWGPNAPMAQLPEFARPAWHLGFVGTRAGLPFGEVKVFADGRVFVVAPSAAAGGDITVSAAFPVGR